MFESKSKLSTKKKIAIILLMIIVFASTFAVVSWILQSQSQNTNGNQNPPTSQRFVGSINSDVYHYPSCHYVDRIKAGNKIWFTSSADARAQGYRPCKVCKPP